MNHEIFEEILAASAFDAVSITDQTALESHFSSCTTCQGMKKSFADVVHLIPISVEERDVPAHVKKNIFAQIDGAQTLGLRRPRPWLYWTFALAATAILAIVTPSLFKTREIGRLAGMTGSVLIDGKLAANNSALKAGQRLTTLPGASAELHLGEKALCLVSANSELSVEKVNGVLEIHLNHGAVSNLVKTGTKYAVVASSLRTEAKGTVFFVETKGRDKVYVCICSGHILLSGTDFRQDLEATHHKAVFASKNEGLFSIEPGPMLDHADEDLSPFASLFK